MKTTKTLQLLATSSIILAVEQAFAQTLYTENFDTDHTANWIVNNNGQGVNAANFFFNYSTVGIPSAPHSTGGSTIGLKLGANLGGVATASLAGISVSPLGQSFTGNYTLKFDWWHNWLGSTTTGIGSSSGGSGSTQLSTFGIRTSGTTPNLAGASDSVFFAADGDGASSLDYRSYSSEATSGYTTASAHATYAAGSQNNTAALYTTLFPAGNTAPATQVGISSTQSGSTLAGTAGFAWHDVEITQLGNTITWTVDGTLLVTIDASNFSTPTAGNNILFGMSDTSTGAGTPASLFEQLDFTLIDNVSVFVPTPEPSSVTLGALGIVGWLVARRRK